MARSARLVSLLDRCSVRHRSLTSSSKVRNREALKCDGAYQFLMSLGIAGHLYVAQQKCNQLRIHQLIYCKAIDEALSQGRDTIELKHSLCSANCAGILCRGQNQLF